MRIEKITIENFQGIEHMEMVLDGKNCKIYGDNASGKTTIANAITWLLYGESLDQAVKYDPRPVYNGKKQYNIITSVTMDITHNSEYYELKKEQVELTKTNKETLETSNAGDKVYYYINDVPKIKKDFEYALTEICDKPLFKVLIDPFYFCQSLKWEDRRELLISICGGVKDDDVFNDAEEDFSILKDMLLIKEGSDQLREVKELSEKTSKEIREIKKEVENIVIRVAEVKGMMPALTDELAETIKAENINYEAQLKEVGEQIEDALTGGDTKLFDKFTGKSTELQKFETDQERKHAKEYTDYTRKMESYNNDIKRYDEELVTLQAKLSLLNEEIEKKKKIRNNILREYTEVDESEFKSYDNCQLCGHPLLDEQIEEARIKFEEEKENKKKELKNKGEKEASIKQINELSEKIKYTDNKIEEMLSRRKAQVFFRGNLTPPEKPELNQIPEYLELSHEVARLRAKVKNKKVSEIKELRQKQEELTSLINANNKELQAYELAAKSKARLSTLQEKQKERTSDYQALLKVERLCKEFEEMKNALILNKINSLFTGIQFELSEKLKNGEVREACNIYLNGAPYNTANNALKINSGLQIIEAIAKYYNIEMPVIIDNAESVVNLQRINNQMIMLIVQTGCTPPQIKTED